MIDKIIRKAPAAEHSHIIAGLGAEIDGGSDLSDDQIFFRRVCEW